MTAIVSMPQCPQPQPQYVVVSASVDDEREEQPQQHRSNVVIRDDRPYHIEDGLFLGSYLGEQFGKQYLQREGITHVLQVADGLWKNHPGEFEYLQIHVEDEPTTDIVAHFSKCFDFIQKATASGGAVFVHCVAGVSRSASVCIGWLMYKHRWSYQQAFRAVRSCRPWIRPNPGFAAQLEEFERLDFDLSRWRAWRHSCKEQPTVVTVIAM